MLKPHGKIREKAINARIQKRTKKAPKRNQDLLQRIRQINPDMSTLQIDRIQEPSQIRYVQALQSFLQMLGLSTLPKWSAETWDSALSEHITILYEAGADVSAPTRLSAALLWVEPNLIPPVRRALPISFAMTRGWNRMEPGSSRPPFPQLILLALLVRCASTGRNEEFIIFWTLFETYARTTTILTLVSEQVVPAVWTGTNRICPVTIVAHSIEHDQNPSKTGEFEMNLPCDLQRQQALGEMLEAQAKRRGKRGTLWKTDYEHLRVTLHDLLKELGCDKLGLTLHSLRHGGASHDVLSQSRDLLSVQLRGQWRAFASVRRYQKSGLVGKVLQKLGDTALLNLQTLAEKFENSCSKILKELTVQPGSTTTSSSSTSSRLAVDQPKSSVDGVTWCSVLTGKRSRIMTC